MFDDCLNFVSLNMQVDQISLEYTITEQFMSNIPTNKLLQEAISLCLDIIKFEKHFFNPTLY